MRGSEKKIEMKKPRKWKLNLAKNVDDDAKKEQWDDEEEEGKHAVNDAKWQRNAVTT